MTTQQRTPGLRDRCGRDVWASGAFSSHLCGRKPKHFENGQWWCRQHTPSVVKARDETRFKAWEVKWVRQIRASDERSRKLNAHDALVAALERAERNLHTLVRADVQLTTIKEAMRGTRDDILAALKLASPTS